jgi:hypothetical protein
MKLQQTNVGELLRDAHDRGIISADALNTLSVHQDLGLQIQNALGVSADDIDASEVFLNGILIDDSSSIRFAGNTDHVRSGHNAVLEALKDSKSENDILVLAMALNAGLLYSVRSVTSAPQLDTANYNPNGGTPLYDQIPVILGTILAKEREFAAQGIPVRTATLIVTDGQDQGSRNTARDVRPVIEDLLKRENHIVAAMGIDDGSTVFRRVFREIGIPDEWILTPGNSPSEIRKAFQVYSRSSVQASQGADAFSQLGGFGN